MCGRCERKKTQTRIGRNRVVILTFFSIQSIMIDKMQSREEEKRDRERVGERQREKIRGSGEKEGIERWRKKSSTWVLIVSTWLGRWGSDQFDRTRIARWNRRRRMIFTSDFFHIKESYLAFTIKHKWWLHLEYTCLYNTHTPSKRTERKRFLSRSKQSSHQLNDLKLLQ